MPQIQIETPTAIIGFNRSQPQPQPGRAAAAARMVAAACDQRGLLAVLEPRYDLAEVGVLGQTLTGGRVLSDTPETYTLPNYLSQFSEVARAIDARRAPLFGYSHAGYFVTAQAIANPESVSALVLVEPALFTESSELRRRAELATNGKGIDSLLAMLGYVDSNAPDPVAVESYAQMIRGAWQSDLAMASEWRVRAENPIGTRQLESLSVPVLLIGGTDSAVAFMVRRAAAHIPHANVWWVRGADHLTLMSDQYATPLANVVSEFLDQVTG